MATIPQIGAQGLQPIGIRAGFPTYMAPRTSTAIPSKQNAAITNPLPQTGLNVRTIINQPTGYTTPTPPKTTVPTGGPTIQNAQTYNSLPQTGLNVRNMINAAPAGMSVAPNMSVGTDSVLANENLMRTNAGLPPLTAGDYYGVPTQGRTTTPVTAAAPTTEAAAKAGTDLSKFNIASTNTVDSNTYNSAMSQPKSMADINKLLDEQAKIRQQYFDSMKPTAEVVDLQTQIADLRGQADAFRQNAAMGIQNIKDKTIPMEFIAGQARSVEERANLGLQTYALQEKNLLDRLGFAQEAQTAQQKMLETGMSFLADDVNLQMQLQDRLIAEEERMFSRAQSLKTEARETLGTILDNFPGITFDSLDEASQSQLVDLARQVGIPVDMLIQGLQTQADQMAFDQVLQMSKLQGGGVNPTSAMQEYMFAVDQGETRGFTEWLDRNQAGGTGGISGAGSAAGLSQSPEAPAMLNIITGLTNHPGFASAVGPTSLARGTVDLPFGYSIPFGAGRYTGETQDFIGKVQQMADKLTLNELIRVKGQGATFGALSDQERMMISNAATPLNQWAVRDKNGKVIGYNIDQESFKKEIQRIESLYSGSNPIATQINDWQAKNISPDKIVNMVYATQPSMQSTINAMIQEDLPYDVIIDAIKESGGFNQVGGDTKKAVAVQNSFKVPQIAMKYEDGYKAGQCGRFVNNATGIGMGDSYQNKLSKCDPMIGTRFNPPAPGDVFVMPYSTTGHTGIVKRVIPRRDGGYDLEVIDSNWGLDERVQTHIIDGSKVTGYARKPIKTEFIA